MCQTQPEKSSDLISYQFFYVRFGLKMIPIGSFIILMTDFVALSVFSQKRAEDASIGECEQWRATDFAVLMEV